MFAACCGKNLVSMSEIDAAPLNWSDLGVSELVPTGTVTLLLADVEGSTRLWQTVPEAMTAAFARLDQALARVVDINHGVRPLEQGEGDSFVIAFGRASDAVACALDCFADSLYSLATSVWRPPKPSAPPVNWSSTRSWIS
jgi:class 3 adenylate cyclase